MSGLRQQLKMLGSALMGKKQANKVKKKPFTEQELLDLRTAFDLLDKNQDGHVTTTDLQSMLKNLGINVKDELINDLIKEASHTGNTLIDETEFLQWVSKIQTLRDETEDNNNSNDGDDITKDLLAAFRVFDRDGNGFITRDELQIAMEIIGEQLTEAQITELLTIADLDKDGKINYEDPFADAIKGADDNVQDGLVHIRIQQRNGRKTLTTVQGLSSEYDLKKIVRACKKEFACNGTVIEHPEYGEVLQLQGDQRENICQWLTKSGLAKSDQLKVHGF